MNGWLARIRSWRGGARAPGSLIFGEAGSYASRSYGTPLDSRPDGKIVVFGIPKSGNVWLVSLLSHYTGLPGIDPVVNRPAPGVGMCHLPYSRELAQRGDFLHGIYLMRDLRDVVVSYYHQTRAPSFRESLPHFHSETIEQFYYEWFLTRVVPFHGLATHAAEFTSRGLPPVRYEDLVADPAAEFARVLRRLGLPVDAARVAAAVEANTLERLRREGRQLDVYVPPSHFRRGGHGGYREELPPPVLRHIESEFGALLTRWGYAL
jgi:hypothetical protein